MTFLQRLVRLATTLVTRAPWLWPLLRRPLTRVFDRVAPVWDRRMRPDGLDPLLAGVARVASARRILDLGTGTGRAALELAARYPDAEVTGVDLSPEMLDRAREKSDRVRWVLADAARLPFADGAFDLVALANMVPFAREAGRVTAPGGAAVVAFSAGPETPIWVPLERLRRDLARAGFERFEEVRAGRGVALVARRREMS